MARLKKNSEAFVFALQFETVKQTSRNQGRIIRRVNVSQDDRKINEEIFMKLMMELQEFLNKRKTQPSIAEIELVVGNVGKRRTYKSIVLAVLLLTVILMIIGFILLM